ncbi:uncharacterized protein LOC21396353 [Morus notabilis]|uniref:uncharacterized protein LOC21396353 n=1 Tax=Morus notabilis TaxID=981085 RepID=UPI000CED6242|nr:uncharacterized protein LOC21396353 [Morus notabilis]
MTSSICRSLRPVIPPRSTPRLLGLSELHRPTTTQPPQQPNSAVINGHAPSDLLTDRPSQPWAHHPLTILYRMSNLRGAGKNDREGFSTAAFSLHRHHPQTLAFNTFGLRGFSTTTVGSAVPREIEAKGKRFGTAKKISFCMTIL